MAEVEDQAPFVVAVHPSRLLSRIHQNHNQNFHAWATLKPSDPIQPGSTVKPRDNLHHNHTHQLWDASETFASFKPRDATMAGDAFVPQDYIQSRDSYKVLVAIQASNSFLPRLRTIFPGAQIQRWTSQ